jgi:acyl-CoA synthetase (AMP-forming)/AMP-acid ligase II
VDRFAGFIAKSGFANMPGANIAPDTPAQIYYTSGTTGKPKGVVLTHRNSESHTRGVIGELYLTKNDRWLHVSSMFHLADSWAVWAITAVGGIHVMLSDFEPEAVFKVIQDHQVSLSNFIPTLLNLMVKHPEVDKYDYSSLRLIMSGGAPIAPEVVRSVIEIFESDYIQTYGMTETSPFLTMSILHEHLRELPFEERLKYMVTTGRPFANVQLKVVDDQGKEVAQDDCQVGEIIVKGDTITPFYWNLPEETKERIKDGWLYTGDLATVNSEGYVTIVDRKDDLIITGGENVYSIEVENVLYTHPAVLEAAVIGIPDEVWGEKITAMVVLEQGKESSEQELIDHCKKELAGFKCPKLVEFVEEIPKTGSGKISKKLCRGRFCNE